VRTEFYSENLKRELGRSELDGRIILKWVMVDNSENSVRVIYYAGCSKRMDLWFS
jgi:hypothetical protein